MGTIIVLGILGLAFAAAAIFGHWLTHEEDATSDGGPIGGGSGFFHGDDAGDF